MVLRSHQIFGLFLPIERSIHNNLFKLPDLALEQTPFWNICPRCNGLGKRKRRLKKKAKIAFEMALAKHLKDPQTQQAPTPLRASEYPCESCEGSGLIAGEKMVEVQENTYPHVAIIGGGIGGAALAVACYHRGIPFTLYERDAHFNTRSQGYGLTLQQASKAMKGLGIKDLKDGVVSTRHLVHNPQGDVLGEWGFRKWMEHSPPKKPKTRNIHIARQSLRQQLLAQLEGSDSVKWGHEFVGYKQTEKQALELHFKVQGKDCYEAADLLAGADGIRSKLHELLLGQNERPLRYLGCMVILGISELSELKDSRHPLLDQETVFQTANGQERIYVMPYSKTAVMWQLSFPIGEEMAIELAGNGAAALKKEALKRLAWHAPIPDILQASPESLISGYPAYDKSLLQPSHFEHVGAVTLLGDAAHPMSPFKGQGANQALLDALLLGRLLYKNCGPHAKWREQGLRTAVLNSFEARMIKRSSPKVTDSAAAASFLHSEAVLTEKDAPRGSL